MEMVITEKATMVIMETMEMAKTKTMVTLINFLNINNDIRA
jgi:type IV secretory pathway ATPase VirB11/archaellum biosynthesis ATPase